MGKKKSEIIRPEVMQDCHVFKYPGKGNLTNDNRDHVKTMIKKHFSQGIIQGSNLPDYVREHYPGFPMSTINGLILETIPEINSSQVIEARFKFDGMYQDVLDKLSDISKKGFFEKETEQVFALKTTAEVIDKYMTFMERWGIKPKQAEIIEVRNGDMPIDRMREIYGEEKK